MTANRLLDVLQRAHLAGVLTEAEALAVVVLAEPKREETVAQLERMLPVPVAGAAVVTLAEVRP